MDSFRNRFNIFLIIVSIIIALVGVQLIRFQLIQHVASQRDVPELLKVEPVARGRIYDRNGYLLSGDEAHFELAYDRNGANYERFIQELAPTLGIPPADILALKAQPAILHQQLIKDLPYDLGNLAREKDIWGFTAHPYWKRAYPESSLAAHVLGFVNDDRLGLYGIEGWYNDVLTPTRQADGTFAPGADVVLTIDRNAQAITEEELALALRETGAESGSIIVMNPRNGEILAMASAPSYDPARYAEMAVEKENAFVNPNVSDIYEPGSIFKILTVAAALDSGTVTRDTVYNDTASIEVGGQLIWNWDRGGYGPLDMTGLLAKSRNVGASILAMRVGQQEFYRYLRAFGLGRPTGIDLQHEAAGLLITRDKNPDRWSEAILASNSFGQAIATTPLQMVTSIGAVANDGVLVQPHVVKKIMRGDRVDEAKIVALGHPISRETARTLSDMLAEAVVREVPEALVEGYTIAGKTGTAQIPIPGGYDDPWTIASFIAYAPAHDPQVIVLVKLDRPTSSMWGSETAVPAFQRLATRLFPVLGVRPDSQLTMSNEY
ncbi:cell division protein FtsI (penicillin-binding protein 3) [Thermoflexales bacterium]|nr:cell division protein FtsI (penicillin-binding protein 3) [Thermoflexales bacterium]